jgi:hypothetical protein
MHLGKSFSSKGALWQYVESTDSRYGYIRDFANSSKHVRLTQTPSTDVHHIANTSFQVASSDSAFGGGVKMKEHDTYVSFDECAEALFSYWQGLLLAVK